MGEEHAQTTEVVDEATGLQSDRVLLTADVASCLPVMSGKNQRLQLPRVSDGARDAFSIVFLRVCRISQQAGHLTQPKVVQIRVLIWPGISKLNSRGNLIVFARVLQISVSCLPEPQVS